MAENTKEMHWFLKAFLPIFTAIAIYGLLDRFVLSKFYGHLESLMGGEDE